MHASNTWLMHACSAPFWHSKVTQQTRSWSHCQRKWPYRRLCRGCSTTKNACWLRISKHIKQTLSQKMHAWMREWYMQHWTVQACCMQTKCPRGHKISTMHKIPSIKAKNIDECSPGSSPRWGTPTSAIRSYKADAARGKLQHSKTGDPQTKHKFMYVIIRSQL